MIRYEDLSPEVISLINENSIVWDKHKRVYFTKLHKEFYLKESEVKSEEYLKEFCELNQYLRKHLEYGVNTEWADSELNKYTYKLNKHSLKNKFPRTIEALSRFYDDSDIIAFYKKELKVLEPTIIDLVGTTGAGKTTFCQQFVDDEGKELLEKTITRTGNSTIIQTDVVILENTKSRLFLKARSKRDIIRDLILVALNIDTDYEFDTRKNITEGKNKEGLKKHKKEIKIDSDIFQGVYNLFRTEELIKKFQKVAKELQQNFLEDVNIQKYINENIENTNLIELIDSIIGEELKISDFYGYRHEIRLDGKYILEKTIIPTKEFNKLKGKDDRFKNIVSYRILFEQAILVLRCDDKAKEVLPEKFKKGIIFRDSQGHNPAEQVGIATDFEVKNKILLIPVGTGGELIDDRYIEEMKNIIISEPKQNIIVITKLDKASSYEKYIENDYDGFIEELKDQVVTTHNNLVSKLERIDEDDSSQDYKLDKNAIAKKFIEAFDNAYLSKITKTREGNYDAELHKILCKNKSNEEIDVSDIEDIIIIDNWYNVISNILESENKVSYNEARLAIKKAINKNNLESIISLIADKALKLVRFCVDRINWEKELDEILDLFSKDFRTIYNEFYIWYVRALVRDISTNGHYVEDKVAKIIKNINSLVMKDTNANAVQTILEALLLNYLEETYEFDKRLDVSKITKRIIANAISKAVMASYKIYDRDIIQNNHETNINDIYNEPTVYVKPLKDIDKYEINKRNYWTDTAYFLGVYCNLLSKFKYNLYVHFENIFKVVLESELEKLDEKAK
ncbi:hypothetical protein FQB35_04100 [Crassaminicella thermophila]|uniref:Uncharacterized protein n=1 Tax=Crassaminicella thermophila TaxID=2599308 RepID=A0A5C0SEB3_CRATE|nr:hypothetical protein [Crassaminicella thermophila]QEK11608.1 hypothetical protein FQB35_04100 [Crassaminicella thermophila]